VQASPFTTCVGSIADTEVVARAMRGVHAVLHTQARHRHVPDRMKRHREYVYSATLRLEEAAQ
jgi:FlaA1/EpsC-like NDP-sugar epimerase